MGEFGPTPQEMGIENEERGTPQEILKSRMERARQEKAWRSFAFDAADMKNLFPEIKLEISDDEWKEMEKSLDAEREQMKSKTADLGSITDRRGGGVCGSFVDLAQSMRMIDSKKSPRIDDETWKTLLYWKADLERDENPLPFMRHASAMRNIAPDRDVYILPETKERILGVLEERKNSKFHMGDCVEAKTLIPDLDVDLSEEAWSRFYEGEGGHLRNQGFVRSEALWRFAEKNLKLTSSK